MANIFIIGDSWGTVNGLPRHLRKHNKHLELLLSEQGHKVTNFSIPGGTNGQSINKAKKYYLKNSGIKLDYIIWFHTESLRDRPHPFNPSNFSIMELTRQQAKMNYQQWVELLNLTNARDIIIGAQAPVITDLLLHTPYHLIEDWRCELLGIPSIMTHSVCHADLFEKKGCRDNFKDKTKMLEQNIMIVDMEKQSDLFPDNAHPGGKAHESLFERISNLLC